VSACRPPCTAGRTMLATSCVAISINKRGSEIWKMTWRATATESRFRVCKEAPDIRPGPCQPSISVRPHLDFVVDVDVRGVGFPPVLDRRDLPRGELAGVQPLQHEQHLVHLGADAVMRVDPSA
jgi:hypothetical protein